MRAVSKALRDLSADELADYHVNERINDRGVLIDTELCNAAQTYALEELEAIQQTVREVTQGEITSVRSPKMREWVLDRVGEQARALMLTFKDGEKKYSIDKSVRANLLALADESPEQVPPDVALVIQGADDVWASSTAKFARLEALADVEDKRVRGAFVFAGGAATGRASSFGAQLHNFPRKCAKDPDSVRRAMVRGHGLVPAHGKRINDVLKGMLRPALIPAKGHVFVVADWSAIEGRVHPWLSNCPAGEAKLNVFRSGLDPYKVNAAATFGVAYDAVDDAQRQVGKVQELALGFLGGPGAFATFGRIYGVSMTEAEVARAVKGWRRANPWAMDHGEALERAYTTAMRHPHNPVVARRITYLFDGVHLWYALPSGRILCYPFARLDADGVSYAKAAWKPAADAKEWPRGRLWRGLACIAKGTRVLTRQGWAAIESVPADAQVWDGEEWVSHSGVAHQGLGRVNFVFGVAMTADHQVLTTEGWKRADQTQGHYRAACRLPASGQTDWIRRAAGRVGNCLRLWTTAVDEVAKLFEVGAGRPASVLRVQKARIAAGDAGNARNEPTSGLCSVAGHVSPMLASNSSRMEKLRGAGHNGVRALARLVRKLLGRHGANVSIGFEPGSHRQQWAVCAGQLPLGHSSGAGSQHAQFAHGGQPSGSDVGLRTGRSDGDRTDHAVIPFGEGGIGGGFDIPTQFVAEVFDLIDCGPRNRFVVQDANGDALIVHNCENVTQAGSNDLLRYSLRQLDGVVLHGHDEIVVECPSSQADATVERMTRVMTTPPEWATGLPLAIGIKVMERYGKG